MSCRKCIRNSSEQIPIVCPTINLPPDNAEKVVLVSCTLHNYIQAKARNRYTPPSSVGTVSAECYY